MLQEAPSLPCPLSCSISGHLNITIWTGSSFPSCMWSLALARWLRPCRLWGVHGVSGKGCSIGLSRGDSIDALPKQRGPLYAIRKDCATTPRARKMGESSHARPAWIAIAIALGPCGLRPCAWPSAQWGESAGSAASCLGGLGVWAGVAHQTSDLLSKIRFACRIVRVIWHELHSRPSDTGSFDKLMPTPLTIDLEGGLKKQFSYWDPLLLPCNLPPQPNVWGTWRWGRGFEHVTRCLPEM